MLKFYNFDIVCQEIPDEITLAVNISGCPNHCPGCHSKWLWEDIGDVLDEHALKILVEKYSSAITCVCFMGGDAEPQNVEILSRYVHAEWPSLKTGWYSGRSDIPSGIDRQSFDFIKLGAYVEALGGLRSPKTNQRLYRVCHDGTMERMEFNPK